MKKRGYSLIEVLIGLAILAIIATVFMQALGVGILGAYRDSQMNKALHLAQSQMEYIKSQPYDDESPYGYIKLDDLPAGFTIDISTNQIGTISMNETQQITVIVDYDENRTVTVEGYKTNR